VGKSSSLPLGLAGPHRGIALGVDAGSDSAQPLKLTAQMMSSSASSQERDKFGLPHMPSVWTMRLVKRCRDGFARRRSLSAIDPLATTLLQRLESSTFLHCRKNRKLFADRCCEGRIIDQQMPGLDGRI
jgi:hypothetical protein